MRHRRVLVTALIAGWRAARGLLERLEEGGSDHADDGENRLHGLVDADDPWARRATDGRRAVRAMRTPVCDSTRCRCSARTTATTSRANPRSSTRSRGSTRSSRQSIEYSHPVLPTQFSREGVRQIELDVFADPDGGRYAKPKLRSLLQHLDTSLPGMTKPGFKVLHAQDVDYNSNCITFVACLDAVKSWSKAHREPPADRDPDRGEGRAHRRPRSGLRRAAAAHDRRLRRARRRDPFGVLARRA